MVLETTRLLLRDYTLEDFEALFEILSDEETIFSRIVLAIDENLHYNTNNPFRTEGITMKHILILVFAAALFLCGCQRSNQPVFTPKEPFQTEVSPEATLPASSPEEENGQLLYLTDSPGEAAEIAELYGIALIRHHDGLAVYRTDEDPREVIRRGIANGWPELSLNQSLYLY